MVVVDIGCVSGASEQLHITQPALTRNIKNLEESLNAILVDRKPRGVVPTEAGHALCRYAHLILNEAKRAARDVQAIANGKKAHVHIGIAALFSRSIVDRLVVALIDTVDLLLDLHSIHEGSAPLLLSGPLHKGIRLALQLGSPATVVADAGHPEGRRLRDYGAFGEPDSERNALLVECGQHWEARAVEVARDCTARFLLACGVVDAPDLPAGWWQPARAAQSVIRVTEAVVATSLDFRFAGPWTGLEEFPDAGTVIAWQDGHAVRTPYPNCVLVMPSLRQLRAGVTVVRFGRREPAPARLA